MKLQVRLGRFRKAIKIAGKMDIVSNRTRSRMMAGIRSKNTKPELQVRRFLHRAGFRFRLNQTSLPGSPDVVLPKYRVAVFVHGCFWHRHAGCRLAYTPATNQQKWTEKFYANQERDLGAVNALLELGWRVVILWECGLRQKGETSVLLAWLPAAIRSGGANLVEWPAKGMGAGA